MSHHYSGPNVGFPRGDARLDLTDLFVFGASNSATSSILIMNVHPSASLIPSGPTGRDPFSPDAVYEFRIDTDNDLRADLTFRIQFSEFVGNVQSATVSMIRGSCSTVGIRSAETILDGAPVSLNKHAEIATVGDYRFFAGWRSDPFFFDPLGALDGFRFSGKDNFLDKDVCGIVLEVPNAVFGTGPVGIWARILDSTGGNWVQADRGGLPAQSIFLTGDSQGEYMAGEPHEDGRFVPIFAHALEHAGGYTPSEAHDVASTLLPDVLRFETNRPAGFPNGRKLTDDVIDQFLSKLTNGNVLADCLGHHRDLLEEFPYLGPPHASYDADVSNVLGSGPKVSGQ
jgi:hypothetical protein